MASFERSGKMVRILAICLMLLPIHTLPLLAAEKTATPSEVTQVAPEKKETVEKKESVVKRLIGVASYYAKRFQGRKTTSGVRYHPDKMTAAHQSLPLGTKVRVTNLANNKEVTVVVNDRCRKKSVPFIDLSRAAAKKLGFFGAGKANVSIHVLKDDES
ncbi:septal ring lytic transglycosylase RlpA family protein [Geomesophilobacter sediminis]|uniref:Probable endolytic peptidoglycan transglycosylase RlpA n=1 Tax=Geomesophilobacter sediminis TaxID=2798584 RepID=A0A8J7S6W5_9BACT|nr:septal ring lytic transglycosylase RlpA family protein [Geomesophilobacter sediminis]MBJ6726622.1 septal ring lytic transglycosylase RlpA family protein [Geomesophilobacter sediminis]